METLYSLALDPTIEEDDFDELPLALKGLQRKIELCKTSGLKMKDSIVYLRDYADEILVASKAVESIEAANAAKLDSENKDISIQLEAAQADANSAQQDRLEAKEFLAKMESKLDKYRESLGTPMERALMRMAENLVGQLGRALSGQFAPLLGVDFS